MIFSSVRFQICSFSATFQNSKLSQALEIIKDESTARSRAMVTTLLQIFADKTKKCVFANVVRAATCRTLQHVNEKKWLKKLQRLISKLKRKLRKIHRIKCVEARMLQLVAYCYQKILRIWRNIVEINRNVSKNIEFKLRASTKLGKVPKTFK